MKRWFFGLAIVLIFHSCARVGSPIGGNRDTIAPKILGFNIDSSRVNVSKDLRELRIKFDEYITLKDIQKNLIISPPIKKIKKILPANIATKELLIQWQDTLKDNTTYSFNFGSSITDYNEGNPLSYYNFAFSTGDKIEETYISGEVHEAGAIAKPSEKSNRVVGLYPINDSTDYRQKPYYIAKADEDGYYELNYVSPGMYKIIAFDDENGNSIYDVGKEKIGFQKENINLEKSVSGLNLEIFTSQKPVKYIESKAIPGGIIMLFEGNPEKLQIFPETEKLKEYQVTHRAKSDSLFIWLDVEKNNLTESQENLKWTYQFEEKEKKQASVFYKKNPKDELSLSSDTGDRIPPKTPFKVFASMAVKDLKSEKWTLTMDSLTQIPFEVQKSIYNPFEFFIKADFQEGKKYRLTIPKETVFSYYQTNPKSYQWNFEGDKLENYGSLFVKLSNAPTQKFWLQLLDSNGKIAYQKYTNDKEIKFPIVNPGDYFVKILVDNNENGIWEGSDFLNNIHAEDIYIFYKKLNIRPLWSLEEDWDLFDKRKLDLQKPATSKPNQKINDTNTPNNRNNDGFLNNKPNSRNLTLQPIR